MQEDIFSKIKTKDSLELLLKELKLVQKSLYENNNEDLNSVLTHKIRALVGSVIKNKMASNDFSLDNYLKQLITQAQNVSTVQLIVAFEPSEGAIDHFHSFIVNACGHHLVLDINYDPSIVGGAVIIYEGQYRDFSFRKIFEKEFVEEQANILKILQK